MPSFQVTQSFIAPTTQLSFREMWGEVLAWNPDIGAERAKRMVNNAYRRIIDFRMWSGLLVKGQCQVPDAYTTGNVTLTNQSNFVSGVGMAWDVTMVGRQFRVGFSTPIYTITEVQSPTALFLDIPWGGKSQAGTTYMIFQNIVNFGANIKRLLAVVNQAQGYRMVLNMPQEVLNIYDTWRTSTGWSYLVAHYSPSPTGYPQFEVYPAPTFQQAFPFLAYVQPPDMVQDQDFPYSFIRSDIIVAGALSDALLVGGPKNNKYYDMATAKAMKGRFDEESVKLGLADDSLYLQNLKWSYDRYPFTTFGSDFWMSHDPDVMPFG